MNKKFLIYAFNDCINSLNPDYFINKNMLERIEILLLGINGELLKAFYLVKNDFISINRPILKKNEHEEIAKITKLRNVVVKKIFSSTHVISSSIKKNTGEFIGHIAICHNTDEEFIFFLETLCKLVYCKYKLLLINSKFNIDKENIKFSNLTEREILILEFMCEGQKDKEISEKLYISISTIRKYIDILFSKTNINNRTALCCYYYNFIINEIVDK